MSVRELHWQVGGQDVSCRIDESQNHGVFHIAGNSLPFRFLDSSNVEIAGRRHRFYVVHDRDTTIVWLDGHTYCLGRTRKTSNASGATTAGSGEIRAIMPGKLLQLCVSVGDVVEPKQAVAIMESMKMESTLVTPISGRIGEVRFKTGDVVEMGDIVVVVESGS